MKDMHGERINGHALAEWLLRWTGPDDDVLIMVGQDVASLMAWHPTGPARDAVNVPVFTLMPDFYSRDDRPAVHHVD